jgi:D-3-phosphoglycerate dehydrogenase / 2-oxoglutarate reductase
MTEPALPRIWFERPVVSSFAPTVEAACSVCGPTSADDRYSGIETAVAAVVGATPYDDAVMARAAGLVVIARTGIGYDAIDVDAATRHGILVCNAPDGPTISTAEHAVTLMLAVAKRLGPAVASLRAGTSSGYYGHHEGIELDGKVLGLVGFGRIARRVARTAEALGMTVLAVDPYVAPETMPATVRLVGSLDELLPVADVISVHVPLSDASRGMFGAAQFEAMKLGAVFVNTARGGLVDQDALVAALDGGRLAGAGLDVTTPEPLPADHPLLARDDVIVTPHVASATREGKARTFWIAFEQAMAAVDGRRPEHLVNPEVWEHRRAATGVGGRA